MAKNIRQGELGKGVTRVGLQCTDPASPKSGDPVICGQLPGVAEADMDATSSITTMNLDCIAELSVKGVNGGGNVAISAGDIVYYTSADTPKLGAKTTGVRFGIAFGNALTDNSADTRTGQLVASGATTTIRVLVGH